MIYRVLDAQGNEEHEQPSDKPAAPLRHGGAVRGLVVHDLGYLLRPKMRVLPAESPGGESSSHAKNGQACEFGQPRQICSS